MFMLYMTVTCSVPDWNLDFRRIKRIFVRFVIASWFSVFTTIHRVWRRQTCMVETCEVSRFCREPSGFELHFARSPGRQEPEISPGFSKTRTNWISNFIKLIVWNNVPSRAFFWVNRKCANCVCYSSRVFVCCVIRTAVRQIVRLIN